MLFLLLVRVIFVVMTLHRGLQVAAPSNVLTRRVKTARPRPVLASGLGALSFGLIGTAHALGMAVTRGGPEWLHLVVLAML